MQVPMTYTRDPNYEQRPGRWNTAVTLGGPAPGVPTDPAARRAAIASMTKGTLIAWDVVHGRPLWKVEHGFPWNGGTLATAGGLVFQGDYAGQFAAYRARDGQKLWSYEAHRGIMAGAVTYRVRGEQYVAVMAGYGGSMGVAAPYPDRTHLVPNGQVLAAGTRQGPVEEVLEHRAVWEPGELVVEGTGGLARRQRRPAMQLRNLGRSGLRVSEVGLGCNNFADRSDFLATDWMPRSLMSASKAALPCVDGR